MSKITKIVLISTLTTTKPIVDALNAIKKEHGDLIDLKLYYPHEIDEELIDVTLLKNDLRTADIVLIDIRGGGRASTLTADTIRDLDNTVISLIGSFELMPLTRIGSFSMKKMFEKKKEGSKFDFEKIRKIMDGIEKIGNTVPVGKLKHMRNYIWAVKYWANGGTYNIKNLLLMLTKEYGGQKVLPDPKPPFIFPEHGIRVHGSDDVFDYLPDYLDKSGFDEHKPTIGLLYHGGMHYDQTIHVTKAFLDRMGGEVNMIPVFAGTSDTLEAMEKFFMRNGEAVVDAVVNFRWFRLNGGPFGGDPKPTLKLLQKMNVPVFAPAPMYMREVEKWKESGTGLSPIEIITAVVLPELDGCIEPIPSCGLDDLKAAEGSELRIKEVTAIEDRIDRIAGRINKWLKLQQKPNNEKKIAFILYDYPPGEDNLGSAAYLDTFESMKILLERMKDEGYSVDCEKISNEKIHEYFLNVGIVNSGNWTAVEKTARNAFTMGNDAYKPCFGKLSAAQRDLMMGEWGNPPGGVMTFKQDFLIPAVEFGNVLVGFQPSRGIHENPGKAYHDKTIPPHHQYIAFYRWLEDVWGADAVVHVGTHGTLEFAKGKEVGMSGECFPDVLIGDLPHLYIYHVVNASEAMIAKRRSYATIVNYNSPSFAASELYEGYAVLEDLIHEYNEALIHDPLRAGRVREKIVSMANELNFGETGEEADVDVIYDELFEIKRSIIPKGLHIIGRNYTEEEMLDFVTFILRYDREDASSLTRILTESKGTDYDLALKNPHGTDEATGQTYSQILGKAEEEAKQLVARLLHEGEGMLLDIKDERLVRTLGFGLSVSRNCDNRAEIENLLRGLNGGYITPNIGGDPIRTPEVLPTGQNTFQFDPRLVPSDAAYERGAEIAENTIQHYYKKYGKYPRSSAVVLWGFETTKTRGETVGQIFSYIGVKVVRKSGAWEPKLEVIPLEEMGRPRIDCVVNVCGFFRDMFPNVMVLIDRAFNLVASLDEPLEMNYVKEHSAEAFSELKAVEGDETTARKLANARIFGPPAGTYGTNVISLIETSNWTEETQLADAYISSMNHVYAENIHAGDADETYRKVLSNVDVVSQVRDSHDYEIVDLDHYYEFFGGLSKAVEIVRGVKPEMLITDTTKELIKTEDIGDVITRGTRTRLLNPKWIDALLEHDFHGAQKIADRVEYMVGLAATTNAVDNWIWSSIAQSYIFDDEMRQRLTENNRFASAEIIKRLMEASKRDYWDATEEEIEKLKNAYLEIEGDIEEKL